MQRFPRTSFAAVIVVWAGAFAVIKALLDRGVGAEEIALARYIVAAPGFAFLLWRAGGLPGVRREDAIRLAVTGLLVVVGYHVSLNVGERYTSSGIAALMVALSPAMTSSSRCCSGSSASLLAPCSVLSLPSQAFSPSSRSAPARSSRSPASRAR